MKYKRNQNGFAPLEILLILIAVAIVGFTVWFVYHSNHQAKATLEAAAKESKGSSINASTSILSGDKLQLDDNKVMIALPKNWVHMPGADVCRTDNSINCIDSVEAAPKDIAKAQTGDAFGVSIAVLLQSDDKTLQKWFFDDYLHAIQTSQYKVTQETVNGNKGLMILDNGGSYQDVYHIVLQNDLAVVTTARTSDFSYEPGTTKIASTTSYTQYVPDIAAIAHSVQFR